MPPPPLAPLPLLPRTRQRAARMAQVYDAEILPLWAAPFGRLLLTRARAGDGLPERATVLDVLCATGFVAADLLAARPALRPADGLRVVATDPSPALLDVARAKAGADAGRRVFFRSEGAEPPLHFDSDVFDLVVSNLGLCEVAQPRALLAEMVRVAKPGGQVVTTLPLRGTFVEFYEMLGPVLAQQGLAAAQERLRAHLSTLPSVVEARSWLVEAGLAEPKVECADFTLLFAGGRDFFFAPVIEYGPLSAWKEVAGGEAEAQRVFSQIKEALDTRPDDFPFCLTVRAGCLSGRKPAPAPVATVNEPVLELGTGEIDILGLLPAEPPEGPESR